MGGLWDEGSHPAGLYGPNEFLRGPALPPHRHPHQHAPGMASPRSCGNRVLGSLVVLPFAFGYQLAEATFLWPKLGSV